MSNVLAGSKTKSDKLNPHISVDCVIFGFDNSNLHVLLIDRTKSSESENIKLNGVEHALPGNLIFDNEDLDTAARRVLHELTGLKKIYLEQFGAFGDPNRISSEKDQKWLSTIREHPKARVVTIGYYSLVNMKIFTPKLSSSLNDAEWVPIKRVSQLPFDHNLILNKARQRLKASLQARPIGFNLLPEKFTLAQLQRLYEVILDKPLDKRNFRRKIFKIDILKKLDEKQKDVAHKPASFYCFDEYKYKILLDKGFENFGF